MLHINGPVLGADAATSIAVDAIGNVHVTGWSWGGTTTNYDYATVKYSSAGVQQWAARYNGTSGNGYDAALSITLDASGNVYVAGYSIGSGTDYDYAAVKYNASGVQQWGQRYNGPGNLDDRGYAMTLDSSGNVYVTGRSHGGGTHNLDYATVKYSQVMGIKTISAEIPSSFKLFQNYPNPFNPVTVIEFSIPARENVKLSVFDILGNKVNVLVNELMNAGSYSVSFDASMFSSGVYFCRLEAGKFTDVKKMMLVK